MYIFNHLIYDNHCGSSHLFNGASIFMDVLYNVLKSFSLLFAWLLVSLFSFLSVWTHFHSIRYWSIIDSSNSKIKHHFECYHLGYRLLFIEKSRNGRHVKYFQHKNMSPVQVCVIWQATQMADTLPELKLIAIV